MGEEIDSHDYVVRFNLSRTDGYEKHTGSKTNFRVISGKSFGYIDNPGYEEDVILISSNNVRVNTLY